MSDNKDLGLESSLKTDEIKKISSDIIEAGIDSILDEGLLKEIPIFSIVYGLTKVGLNIKDRLFLKKILKLLYRVKDIPSNDRRKVIDQINNSHKYRFSVGEKLLFIIDKTDEFEKVDYISLLFVKLIEDQIDFKMFSRCCDAINKTFIDDLKWFLEYPQLNYSPNEETNGLFNSGILHLQMNTTANQFLSEFTSITLNYDISEVGIKLRELLGSKKFKLSGNLK